MIVALARRSFFFVLVGDEIRQIVTVSDLNRLPVRTYLRNMVDHLEWLMAEWIHAGDPEAKWLEELPPATRQRIDRRFESLRQRNNDLRCVDCCTLREKALAVRALPAVHQRLSGRTMEQVCSDIDHIVKLRNTLAHLGQVSVGRSATWLDGRVKTVSRWIDALSPPPSDRRW